jgi:uncharacterized lipoprotein YddW (UPF0748 family)
VRVARIALALTMLAAACTPTPATSAAPAATSPAPTALPTEEPVTLSSQPEYRALWVDGFHEGVKSPAQADRLVADAHRANLNALVIQVRRSGDAYFNKGNEPRSNDILGPLGYDPLEYVIRKAHGANPKIEVHAWVNVYFVGRSSRVFVDHGTDWGNRTRDGKTGGYMDPGNAEATRYTHDVLVDLVRNYPVDGLHLDFVRYPEGGDWGYSPAAVARFQAETGRKDSPPADDAAWSQWRRDQVTGLVRSVYQDTTGIRRDVKLSAALIAYGNGPANDSDWKSTSAYSDVFQDWRSWLADGILDLGVPMNYDSGWNSRQSAWFDSWITWEKDNQGGRKILVGVGAFLNYPEDTMAQISRALAASPKGNKPAGVAIYAYASTSPYGTDDFYTDPDLASILPRQPYADSPEPHQLAARARTYNEWFWSLLSRPDYYRDPARGWVATQPVFTQPAAVPALPWKQ